MLQRKQNGRLLQDPKGSNLSQDVTRTFIPEVSFKTAIFCSETPKPTAVTAVFQILREKKAVLSIICTSLFPPLTATHINTEGVECASFNAGIHVKPIEDLPWVQKLQAQCSTVSSNP